MKIQFFLKVNNLKKAEQFYSSELKLFKVVYSKRAGSLLRNIHCSYFELFLEEEKSTLHIPNNPIFAIESDDCKKEFDRIKAIKFVSGGYLFKDKNEVEPSILEYPLGKNFLMVDPSGNSFLIYEDYYYGTDSSYSQ